MPNPYRTSSETLWANVCREGDCWLWLGAVTTAGYGTVSYKGTQWDAHRLSYTFAHGPIPTGLDVRHACDTPRCIAPLHLSVGTHQDNMDDMVSRRRSNFGERHHASRLTWAIVDEIRTRVAAGETQTALAREFGVTFQQVSKIVRGQNWKRELAETAW